MKKETFVCDHCGNEKVQESKGYPYDAGWVYVYDEEIKVTSINKIALVDMDFCCPECLGNYIINRIKSKREVKNG